MSPVNELLTVFKGSKRPTRCLFQSDISTGRLSFSFHQFNALSAYKIPVRHSILQVIRCYAVVEEEDSHPVHFLLILGQNAPS